MHGLLQAMGRPSTSTTTQPDPWSKWRHMLARGSGIDLADLEHGDPVARPAAPAPGRFYDEQVQTADGRVDCCPPVVRRRDRDAAHDSSRELEAEEPAGS